jgi:hypothetical protein
MSEGRLYAGGIFTHVDGVPATHIAVWDETRWQPLAEEGSAAGVNAGVRALAADGEGNLYIGGEFEWALSLQANRVVRWDGERFHALDGGIDSNEFMRVTSMTTDAEGALFVGGRFKLAGDKPSANIARWGPPSPDDDLDLSAGVHLSAPWPNPFVDEASVMLSVVEDQDVRLAVYDVLGRERLILYEGPLRSGLDHPFTLSGQGLPSGLYFITAVANGRRATRPVVHVR